MLKVLGFLYLIGFFKNSSLYLFLFFIVIVLVLLIILLFLFLYIIDMRRKVKEFELYYLTMNRENRGTLDFHKDANFKPREKNPGEMAINLGHEHEEEEEVIEHEDISGKESKTEITFEDIIKLTDQFVFQFFRDYDIAFMATVLLGIKAELKDKITKNITPTKRTKILKELEKLKTLKTISNSQIEDAHIELTTKLNDLIKSGKLNPKKIHGDIAEDQLYPHEFLRTKN